MFYSNRGAWYTAAPFRKLLDKFNVVQLFSKKGYPFDNACCESFFKYLKKEECYRKNYHSVGELKLYLSILRDSTILDDLTILWGL